MRIAGPVLRVLLVAAVWTNVAITLVIPRGPRLIGLTAGQNVFRKPATLLELDQPISLGTIDTRFALQRELAEDEHDPTRSP